MSISKEQAEALRDLERREREVLATLTRQGAGPVSDLRFKRSMECSVTIVPNGYIVSCIVGQLETGQSRPAKFIATSTAEVAATMTGAVRAWCAGFPSHEGLVFAMPDDPGAQV